MVVWELLRHSTQEYFPNPPSLLCGSGLSCLELGLCHSRLVEGKRTVTPLFDAATVLPHVGNKKIVKHKIWMKGKCIANIEIVSTCTNRAIVCVCVCVCVRACVGSRDHMVHMY